MMDVKVFINDYKVTAFHYLEVERQINRIASSRIILSDNEFDSTFDGMVHGASVEIKAKNPDGEIEILFRGEVVKHSIKKLKRGSASVILDCKDIAYKMTLEKKCVIHSGKNDIDLIKSLANNHYKEGAFRNNSGNTEGKKDESLILVQYNISDWEFALNRSTLNSMYLLTIDGELHLGSFQKREGSPDFDPIIIEYEAEIDSRTQLPKSFSTFWNPGEQKMEVVNAKQGLDEQGWIGKDEISSKQLAEIGTHSGSIIKNSGLSDVSDLQKKTTAQVIESQLVKIRGRIKCKGTTKVKSGQSINFEEIYGLSKNLYGHGFVSGIKHTVKSGRWETDLQVGLPSLLVSERGLDRTHNSFDSPIDGLLIGIVTKLSGDAEERIQVQIPVFEASRGGQPRVVWARWATEHAGKEYGITFRPEVGDEVILGFIQKNPNQAVILGSLYSSSKPSPWPVENEKNTKKGIITKSGAKILFDDEEKSLMIQSNAGKSITINDKKGELSAVHENGNMVVMNKQGILIDSKDKMELKCSGELDIDANKISLKSTSQIQINGAIVDIQGSGTTEVKGGTTAVGNVILDGMGGKVTVV